MNDIKEAYAEYTGGNIWLFYGSCENGNFFLTDDNGLTLILDSNPEDLDESTFPDWQEEHLIKELENLERIRFCNNILDWITDNPDHNGGMSKLEIEAYRTWFNDNIF